MGTMLSELALTIRSKNAGVDHITFDIILKDRRTLDRVLASGALARQTIASIYRIPDERIVFYGVIEEANAVKFTIRRTRPSGGPGEHDVYGSQQYAPLMNVEVA